MTRIDDLLRTEIETSELRRFQRGLERPLDVLALDHLEGGVFDTPPQSERM